MRIALGSNIALGKAVETVGAECHPALMLWEIMIMLPPQASVLFGVGEKKLRHVVWADVLCFPGVLFGSLDSLMDHHQVGVRRAINRLLI
ncbi:hypothetical protein GRJ2_002266600 [Grus japonensis]|uniref:Uncharacterized protein n=1 Tax=Grus japonensis TaxID=30415 RepID=A0ABC9XN79_GRUJA